MSVDVKGHYGSNVRGFYALIAQQPFSLPDPLETGGCLRRISCNMAKEVIFRERR
jgi:hypothetical protein